jgi:hypothetical protein
LTTFCSYGAVATRRQAEIIQNLAKPQQTESPDVAQLAKALAREMVSQKIDLLNQNRE